MLNFSADGARLAVAGGIDDDPRVTVFDVTARQELFTFEPSGTITRCAQFLPDNRVVVAQRAERVRAAGGWRRAAVHPRRDTRSK